jgi:hypothetical protein
MVCLNDKSQAALLCERRPQPHPLREHRAHIHRPGDVATCARSGQGEQTLHEVCEPLYFGQRLLEFGVRPLGQLVLEVLELQPKRSKRRPQLV